MIFANFNIKLFCRFILILFLTLAHLSMGGCASTQTPLSPESRMQLGSVGILALSSTPRVEFHTFAKGWAAGAAKGGALGIVDGLLGALTELQHNPPSGQFAGLMTLITLVVLTAVSTTVYGAEGGIKAVPSKTAREIEENLKSAIGDIQLSNNLVDEIYKVAVSRSELDRYAITQLDLYPPGAAYSAGDLSQKGINTVVEVQVSEAGFRGGSGSQPRVSFYLNAHIRLLTAERGMEIFSRDFQYLSRERPFKTWFTDGARELLSGFKQAMGTLADRIIDEVFIITAFPFDSGIWALPGQPEFGSCWFMPIYPQLKYTSLWHSIRHNSPGVRIRYIEVDSLQPLMKWEAFPRPRDKKSTNIEKLSKISDVTYDLKIWEAANDYPERLIYDINGLSDAQYQPSLPLKQKTKYFWTFRAKYKLEGKPQVTRWGFSNIPSNVPSDYPQRRPGGLCNLDYIPSTNYFRFITP